jgi:hypothetical protein
METRKVEEFPPPADRFQPHRGAWRRLSDELANYRDNLAPELETIQSAKTLTTAQAEETVDLDKLDALSIRFAV